MIAKAFAPGNLSCIFKIIENKDPAKMHSLGVGFSVDKGTIVSVSKNKKTNIIFNNKKIRFPTVESVIKKLTNKKIKANISSDLPLGVGFGMSGASSLATAYALNKLLKLKKTKKELAKITHIAEVENRTGLGDIASQFNGGFLMKTKKGNPLEVERLNIKNKNIYYKVFSKIDTKKVITNKKIKPKINKAADKALNKIKKLKNPQLKDIINISKGFAINSGLLNNKKMINLMKRIEENNGTTSMIMLGNAVFSDKKFKGCKKIRISYKKACLL